MKTIHAAVIGAGLRGRHIYGAYLLQSPWMKAVAVAEPDEDKRQVFSQEHRIPEEFRFPSWETLLQKPRFCDLVIIATGDHLHFQPAQAALQKGYHLLLEKPMSNKPEECLLLSELAQRHPSQVFLIGHVLRYTPFFRTLKRLLDEGAIGRLVTIQHNENTGYYHFAHSFVRGSWRDSQSSSPIILSKASHDMDLLTYLAGARCRRVAAYGDLMYFRKEQAPEGSGARCSACAIEAACAYSARKIYLHRAGSWPATALGDLQTPEALEEAIASGPYGRCVFACDNNVPDHMVTILEFENDVTASFQLTGFTKEISRTIKLMGTHGEICGHFEKNEILVKKFGSERDQTIHPEASDEAFLHGGGDFALMREIEALIQAGPESGEAQPAMDSLEGHLMCFAAEEARQKNTSVMMDEFRLKIRRRARG